MLIQEWFRLGLILLGGPVAGPRGWPRTDRLGQRARLSLSPSVIPCLLAGSGAFRVRAETCGCSWSSICTVADVLDSTGLACGSGRRRGSGQGPGKRCSTCTQSQRGQQLQSVFLLGHPLSKNVYSVLGFNPESMCYFILRETFLNYLRNIS